jgi:hypothetical protein
MVLNLRQRGEVLTSASRSARESKYNSMNTFQSIIVGMSAALVLAGCGLRASPATPTVARTEPVRVKVITEIEPEELSKLTKATELLAAALSSAELRKAILEYPFSNPCTSTLRGLPDCKDLDRANLCEGQCLVDRLKTVDVEWAIRKSPPFCLGAGEIGSTQPPLPLESPCAHRYVQTYGCKLSSLSEAALAGHLLHEYMHVLGYGHDYAATAARATSVPYVVGYMACTFALGRKWDDKAVPAECTL